jgi:hypothetical protein
MHLLRISPKTAATFFLFTSTCIPQSSFAFRPSSSLVRCASSRKNPLTMSDSSSSSDWKPPSKIDDLFAGAAGNKWASINSATAGAREQKDAPVGTAPLQLYSLATPNGMKVGILLEELGVDYDAHGKAVSFLSLLVTCSHSLCGLSVCLSFFHSH